jgi:hypothetical protein
MTRAHIHPGCVGTALATSRFISLQVPRRYSGSSSSVLACIHISTNPTKIRETTYLIRELMYKGKVIAA